MNVFIFLGVIIEWWGVVLSVDSEINSNDDLIYKTRIENEDKSTQIRINETNTQSSNSDIGNKNGYDVCGKGEIIHSSGKYFHADILNEIVD